MAALLRHGARRVGGSVIQRTPAAFTTRAVEEEQGLPNMEHLRPRPTKDLEDVMCLIQERKEELYDLLSSMEGTHSNSKNRKLLKFLSVQVKPRPDDSLWRRVWATERMKDAARATVFVSGLALAYGVVSLTDEGDVPSQTAKKSRAVKAASCLTENQR